jgi:hypothetical protein
LADRDKSHPQSLVSDAAIRSRSGSVASIGISSKSEVIDAEQERVRQLTLQAEERKQLLQLEHQEKQRQFDAKMAERLRNLAARKK